MSELNRPEITQERNIFVHSGIYFMELLVVHLLEEQEDYSIHHGSLPQHMTVMPWFVSEQRRSGIVMDEVAAGTNPIEAEVGETDLFGPNQDIPVHHVGPGAPLNGLHKRVLRGLGDTTKTGWFEVTPRNLGYVGDGYQAHVTTHEGHDVLKTGDRLTIDSLSLVAKTSAVENEKQIIHQVKLGS